MHFDVITSEKDHDKALGYAKEWLTSIDEADFTTEECDSQGAPEPIEQEIQQKGYFMPWKAVLNTHIFLFFIFLQSILIVSRIYSHNLYIPILDRHL